MIYSLDALRGIAAFIVIIFHILISFDIFREANYSYEYSNFLIKMMNESPLHLLWAGNEAVLLFFVLSGFVLAIPFQKGRYSGYKNFIFKRFLRIYLPYIAIMTISVISMMLLYEYKIVGDLSESYVNRWNHEVSISAIIAYVLMINYDTANVNGVVWTLYHEMRMGFVFPFIMLILLKFKPIKSLTLLGLFVVMSTAVLVSPFIIFGRNEITLIIRDFGFTAYYSIFFILGAFLSVHKTKILSTVNDFNKSWKLALLLLSIILINGKWLNSLLGIQTSFFYDLMAGFGIVLLFVVVLTSKLAESVLTIKPLLFLGKISYSLYLVHMIVIMTLTIIFTHLGNVMIGFILSPIISIPVAYFAYKFFEEPAIKLGRNIKKKNIVEEKYIEKSIP